MIVFSGTSYLGLDRHPQFIELVKEGLDRLGTNYGGSRLSPLCPDIFTKVENAFADWTGAPAALLVGSGSAAGQLVARYLAQQAPPLQISPLAHPALWWPRGEKYADWPTFLRATAQQNSVAFTDALDPLGIRVPPWSDILNARPECLVVDDSHLIGGYGPQYAGSWPVLSGKTNAELIITASLGKALALPAGIILGTSATLAKIRALPQFGGASPPAPAFLYAWLHGQTIIKEQRDRLQQHLDRLRPTLKSLADEVRYLKNFPVFGLQNHRWGERLRQKGILISSFRYPDADSPLYSRIVVRADHTDEEIGFLMEVLNGFLE